VSERSSKKEIKHRYYELCKQFHPDAVGGDTRRFQEINRAYQIVSNKSRREMYLRYGDSWDGQGVQRHHSGQKQPDDGEVASQTRNSVLTGVGFAVFVAWYMH
jgi:DnaJ-class molecular chaperone